MLRSLILFCIIIFGLGQTFGCGKRPKAPEKEDSSSAHQMNALTLQGKQLYMQNACHSCHGLEGRGDGPAGKALKPPPRDYRDLRSYKQGSSLEEIVNTLLTGVPGTTMAPYPHISETGRQAIASYVVYLQTMQ